MIVGLCSILMHPDLCVFPLKSIKNEVSLHQYMLETQALANMIIPGEKTHLKKKSHQKKKKKKNYLEALTIMKVHYVQQINVLSKELPQIKSFNWQRKKDQECQN